MLYATITFPKIVSLKNKSDTHNEWQWVFATHNAFACMCKYLSIHAYPCKDTLDLTGMHHNSERRFTLLINNKTPQSSPNTTNINNNNNTI